MTTNTAAPGSPFIVRETIHGHERAYIDLAGLATALAPLLGGTVGECEPGQYGRGQMVFGDLRVFLLATPNQRLDVRCGAPALQRITGHSSNTVWPSITLGLGKGLDRIAADIKRRVLDKAAKPLDDTRRTFDEIAARRARLVEAVERFRAAVPQASVTIPEDVCAWRARLYYNANGFYCSGTVDADGDVSLERTSTIHADKVAAFFALVGGGA